MKYRLGLCLSGGGARCMAHLGILEAWAEQDIRPDIYSGTSAGALVAALLASGRTAAEVVEQVESVGLLDLVSPAFRSGGIFNIRKALAVLLQDLPQDFSALSVPVKVATTNFRTGKQQIFEEGDLKEAVLASCCMPVIFEPVVIQGEPYVDGGLLSNLPVHCLREQVDTLVGIHTNPVGKDFKPHGIRSLIERSLLITINTNVQHDSHLCDLFIEPDFLMKYKVFDLKKSRQIYAEAYEWAAKQNWLPLLHKKV